MGGINEIGRGHHLGLSYSYTIGYRGKTDGKADI